MNKLVCIVMFFVACLSGCVTQTLNSETGKPVIQPDKNPAEMAKNRTTLALRYLKTGNYSQAKYNLDKALEFAPNMPEVHYSLAYYYTTVNEIENANKSYQKVLSLDPNNGDALNNYGVFLCQHNKIEDAEVFFLKAVEQDEYIRESQTFLNLGVCMLEHKQKDKAIVYLQRALDHNPYNGKALLELSDMHFKGGEVNEAREYLKRYERRSKLVPRSMWLGYQIEVALGDKAAAEKYGRKLVRHYPTSAQAKAYIEVSR